MSVVKHAQNLSSESSDRLPSENVWASFPMEECLYYPGRYFYWWDDFHNVPLLTTNTADEAVYASYIDTSNTITALATEKNRGVLRLLADATDNDGPVVTMQGNTGNSILLDDNTAADRCDLWYEHRFRKSSITAEQCAVFIGFVEEARAADNGLMADDSGIPTATIDALGFSCLHASPAALDFVWQKASQTRQEIADVDVLVASTWYKNGFRYNTANLTDKRGIVYINNVDFGTYLTGTQMAASTFPDGEELVWAAGLKTGEATSVTMDLDWIRIGHKLLTT